MSCCLQLEDVTQVVPTKGVTVKYPCGEVSCGLVLTPTQVQKAPEVSWEAEKDALYTLMLVDPDAPSRKEPTYREWFHWWVVNVPESRLSEGETVYGYVGAGPPQGTGLHRYVFLVFKQNGKVTVEETRHTSTQIANRACVKAMGFAQKYGLGNPVFINVFQAEYDDYVPHLYKSFSG